MTSEDNGASVIDAPIDLARAGVDLQASQMTMVLWATRKTICSLA